MEGLEHDDVFDGIDISAKEFFQLIAAKDDGDAIPQLAPLTEEVVEESCWGAQLRHHTSNCVPGFRIGKGHVSWSREPESSLKSPPPAWIH